jgi:hypothetical protein
LKIKAPWGCDDPYCWDHVFIGICMFGVPVGIFCYEVCKWFLSTLTGGPGSGWLG